MGINEVQSRVFEFRNNNLDVNRIFLLSTTNFPAISKKEEEKQEILISGQSKTTKQLKEKMKFPKSKVEKKPAKTVRAYVPKPPKRPLYVKPTQPLGKKKRITNLYKWK